jgi:hypothetical protein
MLLWNQRKKTAIKGNTGSEMFISCVRFPFIATEILSTELKEITEVFLTAHPEKLAMPPPQTSEIVNATSVYIKKDEGKTENTKEQTSEEATVSKDSESPSKYKLITKILERRNTWNL